MMLRECIRVQELAEIILRSPDFYKFFDYVQKSTFDIASDAFATFKVSRMKEEKTNSRSTIFFFVLFLGFINETQSTLC